MQTVGSIEIDCPIEEVFRLTTEHVAEWSTVVVEDELIEEKPGSVGTTFRTMTEEHGKQMEFQGEIIRHEPPRLNAVYLTGEMFDIDVEYVFEEQGRRTLVTQKSEVHGKGFLKWFFLLFGWLMKRANRKAINGELECLKQFCEAKRPT